MKKTKKRFLLILIVAILLATVGLWFFVFRSENKIDSQTGVNTNNEKQNTVDPVEKPEQINPFNKSAYSTNEPDSIWVVVNKRRPLSPLDYQPSDLHVPEVRLRVPGHETMKLRSEAAKALETMFAAAQSEKGLELMLSSGHRSYAYQQNLYNGYVRSDGQAAADTYSARPGHSEHQTGLAADLRPTNGKCELEACFGEMAEGIWVAENAYRFGFILRYTEENEQIAGYTYEPWHVRYVGINLAAELRKQSINSLEEFFDLGPAPSYE